MKNSFLKFETVFFASIFILLFISPLTRGEQISIDDIFIKVWEKSKVQQAKLKDYTCNLRSTVQEIDSSGKIENITEILKKSYFKQPNKNYQEFICATKNGKPVTQKDLQPGLIAASFRRPAEELAEEILEELKSIIMFSPNFKENFYYQLIREENLEGNNTWVFQALSNTKEIKLKKVFLWIDQKEMRTVKIEAESIDNPSSFVKKIKVSSFLTEVNPGIYLPKITKIETRLSKVSSKQIKTHNEFTNYQINTGLDDKIFQKNNLYD